MPTQNQIDQANFAAAQARAAAAATPPPVSSAQEAADTAHITEQGVASRYVLPTVSGVAAGMAQPYNLVTTGAEIAGGVIGARRGGPAAALTGAKTAGRLAQPLATAAQRKFEGKRAFGKGFVGDTAYNAVFNEGANLLGRGLGKAASAIGQSAPVQSARGTLARWGLGRVTPDARDAFRFSGEMIDDVEKAVNAVRRTNGQPLYTRQAVEAKLATHLEQLKARGAFNIAELTTGSKVDAIEPIASGSIAGKGTFASKQEGKDALMEGWPKVFAAMLGDEAAGPDTLAMAAAMSIEGSLKAKQAAAGAGMQAVEEVVGKNIVPIDEGILDPLSRQLELYAKRYRPAGGAAPLKLDPEGIDAHLKSAIALVERATGRKFDPATNTFVEALDPSLKGQPQAVIDAMRAQGVLPTAERVDFTFSDLKTLKSSLDEIQAKLPEGEKNQANATLGTFSGALRAKMNEVLDATDAASGAKGPASLRERWNTYGSNYERAMRLRDGFNAQGWIDTLKNGGNGRDVIPQIWPDNADINRVSALKELMGGESSEYWKTLKRFKVEQMLGDKTKNPQQFVEFLTDPKVHSVDYWRETLGKDQYDRVLKYAKTLEFAGRKNPFRTEGGMARRVDAGVLLALTLGATRYAGDPMAAAGLAATTGGWLVTTKKIAQWLTNPADSAAFMHLMSNKPLTLKTRVWFRNQVARAVADASKDEQPEIRQVPVTATRATYANATGRAAAGR